MPIDPRWLVLAGSCLALGCVVGIPYFGMPFFYDYFERDLHWSRSAITLGLPLGTLATLWAGPLLVPRVRPRLAILAGAAVCAAALALMGSMQTLAAYYGLWMLYMAGWTFSGPLAHQILLAQWFPRHRGKALALAYLGVNLFGAASVAFVARPLTASFGFRGALTAIGAIVLLAVPVALTLLRDGPPPPASAAASASADRPWRSRPFWLLLIGSTLSIGAIGCINQHLKLLMKEAGFADQAQLDRVYGDALFVMLVAGALGRTALGWLADHFPKRHVVSGAFLMLAASLPFLLRLAPPDPPYVFALLFGIGMGADFLLTPLLVAEHFGAHSMARAMAIIVPVNTVGQTWCPYGISLLREATGGYGLPLAAIIACALAGRGVLALLPNPERSSGSPH